MECDDICGKCYGALNKEIQRLQAELDKHSDVTKRIVDYFCSDKALFPHGTLKAIWEDAEALLES